MAKGYQWIATIDALTKGDKSKENIILELPWISCMNTLSYWHARDDYHEKNRVK